MTTSFYNEIELREIGFKSYGKHVQISKKVSIYGAEKMEIGDNVRIDDFCIISGCIQLGSNIHIAAYSALYGGSEGIYIDDYANISSRVAIYSISDDYSGKSMTNPTIPEKFKHVDSRPVHIRRHVIIGSTSVVTPGVVLAEGSAFGAFSFVNHDSEPWSMNVGIPFRRIGDRSKDLLRYEDEMERQS